MKQAILSAVTIFGALAMPAPAADRAAMEAAAAKGGADAQFQLAHALYWAEGMKRDLEASADWAARAAKAGHPKAQFLHAFQLLLAHGVESNSQAGFDLLAKTHPALEQAVDKGDAQAAYFAAQLYLYGYNPANDFRQDIPKGRALMLQAARQGNHPAAYWLAQYLFARKTDPRDLRQSAQLLEQAARAGHAYSANLMGELCLTDLLGPADPKRAAHWLKQAADAGLAGSQQRSGNLLASRALGQPDMAAALESFRRSAQQGYWPAQELLARTYHAGSGEAVPPNAEEAAFWFALFARQRELDVTGLRMKQEIDARLSADQSLEVLRRVNAFKPTPTDITQNEHYGLLGCSSLTHHSLREDLLQRLVGEEHVVAAATLGEIRLERGRQLTGRIAVLKANAADAGRTNTAAGRARAAELLETAEEMQGAANKLFGEARVLLAKAAGQDNINAQHSLAAIYIYGLGVDPSPAKAVEWFERAAAQKDVQAMTKLAELYTTGKLVKKNEARAFELYTALSDMGNAPAQSNLAIMYFEGNAVAQDLRKAEQLMQQAAAQGLPDAQNHLARFYMEGHAQGGINFKEAVKWYRLAARQGHADAQMAMGMAYHFGDGVEAKDSKQGYQWLLIAGGSLARNLAEARRHPNRVARLEFLRILEDRLEQNKRRVAAALTGKEIEEAGEMARKFVPINLYRPGQSAPTDAKALAAKANRGDAEAQYQLGLLHLKGIDGPANLVEAYKWFTLAKENGHATAGSERDTLSRNMENAQIIAAKKLARKFVPVKE